MLRSLGGLIIVELTYPSCPDGVMITNSDATGLRAKASDSSMASD